MQGILDEEYGSTGLALRGTGQVHGYSKITFERWGKDLLIEIDDSSFVYINATFFYYLNMAAKWFIKYFTDKGEVKKVTVLLDKLQKHFAQYRPR